MTKRVLVVLPMYGGSLPVGRYCARALTDLGCLVDVFEAPAFYGAFEALKGLRVKQERLEYLENSFLNTVAESVLAQVDRFQPDLLLCAAQAPLSRKALQRLKRDGVATAMWFVEDYRLFVYWRAYAPLYDIFAVIQKEPFLGELDAAGVENVLYLPLAALPEVHRPLDLNELERRRFRADLSFMGAGYPNRRAAFRQLLDYDLKIWGTEWENEPDLDKHLQMKGMRISSEDAVRIFNAAAINLNLHSSTRAEEVVSSGDFVNPRTFEIASCGAFQLVDGRTLLPELFTSEELVTFDSLKDLQFKIDYFLERPEERAAWACRARERVLREHTYQTRMARLLEFAAERLPGWPPSAVGPSWPEGLPLQLQHKLDVLFKELKLAPGADFSTVIAALRGRSGKLSPLESALLFLDEWKKQYLQSG